MRKSKPEANDPAIDRIESPYEVSYWASGMDDFKPSLAAVEIISQGDDHLTLEILWEPVEKGYHRTLKLKLYARAARGIAYDLLSFANNLDEESEDI